MQPGEGKRLSAQIHAVKAGAFPGRERAAFPAEYHLVYRPVPQGGAKQACVLTCLCEDVRSTIPILPGWTGSARMEQAGYVSPACKFACPFFVSPLASRKARHRMSAAPRQQHLCVAS